MQNQSCAHHSRLFSFRNKKIMKIISSFAAEYHWKLVIAKNEWVWRTAHGAALSAASWVGSGQQKCPMTTDQSVHSLCTVIKVAYSANSWFFLNTDQEQKLCIQALISGAILSSRRFKWGFWCLLKLEVMSGRSLIGCQEDSKYFHTHTADTRRCTEQIHPVLIGQIGFRGLECKIINRDTHTHTQADTPQWCTVGAPNKDLSGLFVCRTLQKSQWSASLLRPARRTYGQLKCRAKRGETARCTEELPQRYRNIGETSFAVISVKAAEV